MHRVTPDPSTLEACSPHGPDQTAIQPVPQNGSSGSGSLRERTGRQQRPSAVPVRPRHPGAEDPQVASPRRTRNPSITHCSLSRHGGHGSAYTPQPQAEALGCAPQGPPVIAGGRGGPAMGRGGTSGQPTPRSEGLRLPRPAAAATPSPRRLGRRPAAARTPARAHPASAGRGRCLEPSTASDGLG